MFILVTHHIIKNEVQEMILLLLPLQQFDIIISHNPAGEYTRHIRHEETRKAVIELWLAGRISAHELWAFAYEDDGRQYLPKPVKTANIYHLLPEKTWQKKYKIMTETYGFKPNWAWAYITKETSLRLILTQNTNKTKNVFILRTEIIRIDLDDNHLKVAKTFGATHIINSNNENADEKVMSLTNGRRIRKNLLPAIVSG